MRDHRPAAGDVDPLDSLAQRRPCVRDVSGLARHEIALKTSLTSRACPASTRKRAKWVRETSRSLVTYLSAPSYAPGIPAAASASPMRRARDVRPSRIAASPR